MLAVIHAFPKWYFLFHFAFVGGVSWSICRAFRYRFMLPIILLTFAASLCLSLLWNQVGGGGQYAQEILWEAFDIDYSLNPWPIIIPGITLFWLAPMYLASLVIRHSKKKGY
jgi:hypothetical protein